MLLYTWLEVKTKEIAEIAMMTMHVELTDLFGGEANYAWVRSESVNIPDNASDRYIITLAKNLVDMRGVRHKKEHYGDEITLRFPNANVILFISFEV